MKKIKVVHLISTDVFSGAENVACQIINLFKNNNDYEEMIYISVIGKNKKCLEERNINYYEIKSFNYKEIKKAFSYLKPDVIHAHDIKASIIAALFSDKYKIISHVHANHENMRKITLKTLAFNIFNSKFSKVFWVSKSALDNYIFKKNVLEKSSVLYNIIDSKELKNKIKSDSNCYINYDVIYLGRLTYQKNPERLLYLLKKICMINSNVKIAIIGNGEYSNFVSNFINNNNLENNITYFGFLNNPYKILSNSKLMVMTSRYEGTPMCALEAMSLGIPIVSTPTDGMKDIITNNINGFLSDDDDILIEKIIEYINPDKRLKKNEIINEFYRINDINNYLRILDESYRKEVNNG